MTDLEKKASKRVSRQTWLQTGLGVLAELGPQGLTIERLCALVNRSKGSFYFHFATIDLYKAHLLAFWEESHTGAVEAGVNENQDPVAQRLALPGLAAMLDNDVERAIRHWSQGDAAAKAALAKVDARRVEFVAHVIAQTNQTSFEDAHELASIEYAAFLGFQHLLADASEGERQRMYERVLYLISPNLAQQPAKAGKED